MPEYLIIKREHFDDCVDGISLSPDKSLEYLFPKKRNNDSRKCIGIYPEGPKHRIQLSYFIGVDWINIGVQAIYVQPKLNEGTEQTNYLEMLFAALRHPEVNNPDELFEIKFDQPHIEIDQSQDMLTPLLVVQFLKVVKEIVRKGLKKSYYKVESNLIGKIKGKILVGTTIKKNLFKNKPLLNYCSYQEFGLNGLENRLLKKALIFVQRYLPTIKKVHSEKYTADVFGYVMPAFEQVSEEVSLHEVKHTIKNVFYKEYEEAIKLARLILQRFGYNIINTQSQTIKTPPFWIDMSKLFELYVLGMLKEKYGNSVKYQAPANYGNPDYLLVKERTVVDAKYKTYYKEAFRGQAQWKRDKIATDIRQICGYARDIAVLRQLGVEELEYSSYMAKCLIIYPDQNVSENLFDNQETPIPEFANFYKIPIKLPTL